MSSERLSSKAEIDLASIALDYERFRELALNPNLSANQRIGFPDAYRSGYENAILADISTKLTTFFAAQDGLVVDIGPGCAALAKMTIDICADRRHRLILVDSGEMLKQLPDPSHVVKVEGPFPRNLVAVQRAAGRPVSAVLCYSVLHYMYVDTNLFDVMDGIMELLAPGGQALIGDVPNHSKRRRFFASDSGVAFHQAFMNTDKAPPVDFNSPAPGRIDDAVISGLIQRCQAAGCDAYVVPQAFDLPMANRRDDLLVRKP